MENELKRPEFEWGAGVADTRPRRQGGGGRHRGAPAVGPQQWGPSSGFLGVGVNLPTLTRRLHSSWRRGGEGDGGGVVKMTELGWWRRWRRGGEDDGGGVVKVMEEECKPMDSAGLWQLCSASYCGSDLSLLDGPVRFGMVHIVLYTLAV
ncbi:unnamed protein product [Gadus morhua 'NCC']